MGNTADTGVSDSRHRARETASPRNGPHWQWSIFEQKYLLEFEEESLATY
jgi:hypothetical protein